MSINAGRGGVLFLLALRIQKNYPAVYAVDAHRAFTYDAANIRNFFA